MDMNQIDLDDSSRGSLPADKGTRGNRFLTHARPSNACTGTSYSEEQRG